MTKFNPPKIKSDKKYTVGDVLVLHELSKRATFVNDPLKTFTGHTHSFHDRNRVIDFAKVVSNIYEKGLIRENTPKELLDKLILPDLKNILKHISKPTYGTKKELITRINKFASDEDINRSTEKRYFVLTELGLEILDKYKNVIWIYKNKEHLFCYPIGHKSKFNEYYFMKHWDVDPGQTIIDYYEPKDSGIVSRVYIVQKDFEKGFYYWIKKLADEINFQLEKSETGEMLNRTAGAYEFGYVGYNYAVFDSLNISDDSLEEILEYIYNYSIEDPTKISYNDFSKLIKSLLIEEDMDLYFTLLTKAYTENVKRFNSENKYIIKHDYYVTVFDGKEISDETPQERLNYINMEKEQTILEWIDDLDLEAIENIKRKIDDMFMK